VPGPRAGGGGNAVCPVRSLPTSAREPPFSSKLHCRRPHRLVELPAINRRQRCRHSAGIRLSAGSHLIWAQSNGGIVGCVPTICTCDRQRRVPSWLLCAARPPGPLGFRCSVPRDGWRERDWKTSALKARRPFAARYLWWRKRQNRFKGSISACGVARRRNDGVVSDGIVSSPITLDRLIVPALG
jgi:hypothetical protein